MPSERSPIDSLMQPGAALRAARGSLWRQWQAQPSDQPVALAELDPAAKPWSTGDKASDKAATEALAGELDGLQDLFHADGRYKLLVVLQGTDTAGKDGTVRGVFSRTSPLGVHTVGWRAPTETERKHDFLWRIHQQMPGDGEIMVFNRSHYEDVLVPVVNGWISKDQTLQRYAQINDFERMARICLPLQEARRQKREQAWDTGPVALVRRQRDLPSPLVPGLYLLQPPMIGRDGRSLRETLDRRKIPASVLTRKVVAFRMRTLGSIVSLM